VTEDLNGTYDYGANSFVRHIKKKWYVYFLCAGAFFLLAFAYINLRPKEYLIKSRILISETSENDDKLSDSETPKNYTPVINPNAVENTINTLSSRAFADSAVKKMSLCFKAYREGGLTMKEVYLKNLPITIETISFFENQFAPKEYHFVLLDSAWFKLTGE
jgi:hypothetical protein